MLVLCALASLEPTPRWCRGAADARSTVSAGRTPYPGAPCAVWPRIAWCGMYEGWRIARWETPVVDLDRLLMVSLADVDRELVVVLESFREPDRPRWRVRFRHYPAYRNIDESYRLELWRWLDPSGQRAGSTFTVEEAPPLASWGTEYLHQAHPRTRHFVIATQDDVIEVLSMDQPIWEVAEPATKEAPVPGKAQHLFVGEDDAEIEELVRDLQRRQSPPDRD